MDSIWIWLIVYSIVILIIAMVIGVSCPRWRGWRWIDLPYYALSAMGVVMFFATDRNIRLQELLSDQKQLQQEWAQKPNRMPEVSLHPDPRGLVNTSYQGLLATIDLGETCTHLPTVECSARSEIGDQVAKVFNGFSPSETSSLEQEARLEEDYCGRGYRLFDALDALKPLDAGAYQLAKNALVRQSQKHGDTRIAAGVLGSSIASAQAQLRIVLGTEFSETASTIMKVHGDFAVFAFQMVAFCSDRPPDQGEAVQRLQAWRGEEIRRQSRQTQLAREVENAKRAPQPTRVQQFVKAIKEGPWAYVIVFALALKFGKAWAELGRTRRLWKRQACRSSATSTSEPDAS